MNRPWGHGRSLLRTWAPTAITGTAAICTAWPCSESRRLWQWGDSAVCVAGHVHLVWRSQKRVILRPHFNLGSASSYWARNDLVPASRLRIKIFHACAPISGESPRPPLALQEDRFPDLEMPGDFFTGYRHPLSIASRQAVFLRKVSRRLHPNNGRWAPIVNFRFLGVTE